MGFPTAGLNPFSYSNFCFRIMDLGLCFMAFLLLKKEIRQGLKD